MACHIEYEVEEEAATGFFKAFVRIRHLNTIIQIHPVLFQVQILGMGLTIIIISSTDDADDEDDKEVVFGAGAYGFQPRFPPGASRDRRPPRENDKPPSNFRLVCSV